LQVEFPIVFDNLMSFVEDRPGKPHSMVLQYRVKAF